MKQGLQPCSHSSPKCSSLLIDSCHHPTWACSLVQSIWLRARQPHRLDVTWWPVMSSSLDLFVSLFFIFIKSYVRINCLWIWWCLCFKNYHLNRPFPQPLYLIFYLKFFIIFVKEGPQNCICEFYTWRHTAWVHNASTIIS